MVVECLSTVRTDYRFMIYNQSLVTMIGTISPTCGVSPVVPLIPLYY